MACKAHILTYLEILLTAENAEFAEKLSDQIYRIALFILSKNYCFLRGLCGLRGEKYRPTILIKLCKTKPIYKKVKWM